MFRVGVVACALCLFRLPLAVSAVPLWRPLVFCPQAMSTWVVSVLVYYEKEHFGAFSGWPSDPFGAHLGVREQLSHQARHTDFLLYVPLGAWRRLVLLSRLGLCPHPKFLFLPVDGPCP